MSLKFGLYLVEQGIITCDQFCGLVKIQQESKSNLSTIAIQKNIMTIKQVATVLEQLETTPNSSFVDLAIRNDFIEHADAQQLLQLEQFNRPTIRQIVANVGLMTDDQVTKLYEHYERMEKRGKAIPPRAPHMAPGKTKNASRPPQPKFKQHPVVVHQDYSAKY